MFPDHTDALGFKGYAIYNMQQDFFDKIQNEFNEAELK